MIQMIPNPEPSQDGRDKEPYKSREKAKQSRQIERIEQQDTRATLCSQNSKNQKVEKKHRKHENPSTHPKIKNHFRSFPRTPIAQTKRQRAVPQELLKKREKQCREAKRTWYRESKKVEREEVSESKSRSKRPSRGTSRPECCSLCSFPFSCLVCDKFRGGHESTD
jgi:hypothetical protein